MTPNVEARRNRFSPAVLAKIHELSLLISQETYGAGGPSKAVTWAEIEDLGHAVGRLTATEFDQTVQRQQAGKFDHSHDCPQCGRPNSPSVQHRELDTRDGPADLAEPTCHCNACERSFFPSTRHTRIGR
jgi:NADH pyrophosphatase NudC (nudix superfamily)